ITGLFVYNYDYCNNDKQCEDTCCKFYKLDSGVCDEQKNCDAILEASKQEYMKLSALEVDETALLNRYMSMLKLHPEAPAKKSNYNTILAGLVLILLAVVSFLIKDPDAS
ncbi:hypothetical protein D6777_00760, partial [Candidatus Woesearchaeota archaeon]